MKKIAIFSLITFLNIIYIQGQTYNVTNKTIGSPNYGKQIKVEVEETFTSKLNRQNQERLNDKSNSQMLIEGARDAYGSGLNISGSESTNFNFPNYNSSTVVNNIVPAAKNSEIFSVKAPEKDIYGVVLVLNGYFKGNSIKNAILSNGLILVNKKYYSKQNVFDIDFKKLNKKEKLNLTVDNIILWRFDQLRYNSSFDFKYKVRCIDHNGSIFFDGDFENISSAESVWSVIRAVNEEAKKLNSQKDE